MTILHIDFETRSACDLKAAGLHNYAAHPTTDVWCMAWSLSDPAGDDLVYLWTPASDEGAVRIALDHVHKGGLVLAHNAAFELAIWNEVMVKRYGWPELRPEQVRCTMAMCYSMALPGALEKAAPALGIDMRKDASGQRVMMQLAKPKAIAADGSPIWHDDPAKLEKLYAYCKQDVEVERAIHKRLLELPNAEQDLWLLDQRINNRGIYVDLPAVKGAIEVVEYEQDRLNNKMRSVTKNAVATCSAVGQLGDWLKFRGVSMPGVAKADVLDALTGDDLPADVRTALGLRQEAAKTSTAKLKKMVESASADGRLRGMFQYHGAGTGRWAARKVQLHNLPRPKLKQPAIEQVIDILGGPMTPGDKARLIEMLFGSPLDVISSCLRGMLTAAPGKDLIAADFSNIEGRVIAWLAGETWKLQAFRDFDEKRGPDLYLVAASKIYHKSAAEFTKESPEREVGKRCELAFGFGGGLGAWRKFEAYATADYVAFPDDQVEAIKNAWRAAHPALVAWWYALEDAAVEAVSNPGRVVTVHPKDGQPVKFKVAGSFLWCKLPSGRNLCYPYPKLQDKETPWGELKPQAHYMTVDGLSNKWVETNTYGGRLAENVTQAVARDVLADAMMRLDARGYDVVLHCHDEAVVEVSADAPVSSLVEIESLMKTPPGWAAGIPIATEGWRSRRYRK